MEQPLTPEERRRIGLVAATAYHPAQPIRDLEAFAGRDQQIQRLVDAVYEEGSHAMIYGERGVGKTSLANLIRDFLSVIAEDERVFCPHVTCQETDTFDDLWRKVIAAGRSAKPSFGVSEAIWQAVDRVFEQQEKLDVYSVQMIAAELTQTHRFVPILDEFDRVHDETVKTLMTDTLKTLSDHNRRATVLLVGVAETVDDLVEAHASVERCLKQILLPRMAADEAVEVLNKGERITSIGFDSEATALMVGMAQGLPACVHRLGLSTTRVAVKNGQRQVTPELVGQAAEMFLRDSEQSLHRAYHAATSTPRSDTIFREVLLACALAPTDLLGYFAPKDVRRPLQQLTGRGYDIPQFKKHLDKFITEPRGAVLRRVGESRRFRYRFQSPMLQPFVILRGLHDGLLDQQTLETLQADAESGSSA